jgi:hypothetical protein
MRCPRQPFHFLLLGLVAGCSGSPREVNITMDKTQENLLHVGSAYSRYLESAKKPPTSTDHLKPYLKEFGNPDELLRSSRDGEPFVICWGVDLSAPPTWATQGSTPVIAYEKRGSGGQRYVLTTMRNAMLLSEEAFKQASFPPGHKRPDG